MERSGGILVENLYQRRKKFKSTATNEINIFFLLIEKVRIPCKFSNSNENEFKNLLIKFRSPFSARK
jgi:hypothetical protein